MARFNEEFDKLMKAEGGYVNDPNDAGGETYAGVSRKNHPKWSGWKIIDEIKSKTDKKDLNKVLKQNVKLNKLLQEFYKFNFWDIMDLDDIPSQKIAHQLFDTAVNCGRINAIKFAQRTLGITPTGRFDSLTKEKLMSCEK